MTLNGGGQPEARAQVEGLHVKYICIKGLKIPPLLRKYEYGGKGGGAAPSLPQTLAPNAGGSLSELCKTMHCVLLPENLRAHLQLSV
jgi:hypothetical protein